MTLVTDGQEWDNYMGQPKAITRLQEEVVRLRAEVKFLKEELNIARLQRDAKMWTDGKE